MDLLAWLNNGSKVLFPMSRGAVQGSSRKKRVPYPKGMAPKIVPKLSFLMIGEIIKFIERDSMEQKVCEIKICLYAGLKYNFLGRGHQT